MKWQDLKTVIVEAGDKVIIAVTFQSGARITIRNVPKELTTKPDFEKQVSARAKKAEPNETYADWSVVGSVEADSIDTKPSKNPNAAGEKPGAFKASEEAKEDMQNVLDLHRLIMNTMEKSVWKGLKSNTDDNIDKGLYYLPRKKDPVFPKGVSFEYTKLGKKYKITDVKEEIGITVVINTINPKKDQNGYELSEGWPVYANEWDDMKQITIDAVNARENITTVEPSQPKQKVDGPLRIAISPKSFFYRDAVVPSTDNN